MTGWNVSGRASSLENRLPLTRLEGLNDNASRIPPRRSFSGPGDREQQSISTGQDLRTIGFLSGLHTCKLLRRPAAIGRASDNSLGALPNHDAAIVPRHPEDVVRVADLDRRATANLHALDAAILAEPRGHRAAIGRERRLADVSPRREQGSRVRFTKVTKERPAIAVVNQSRTIRRRRNVIPRPDHQLTIELRERKPHNGPMRR